MTQTTARLNAQCRVKVTARRGPSQFDGDHCEMNADRLSDDWMTRDNLEERIHPSMILSAVPYFRQLCKVAANIRRKVHNQDGHLEGARVGSAANDDSAFNTADINVRVGQDSVRVKGGRN